VRLQPLLRGVRRHQAAAILGVTPNTLDKWRQRGLVRYYRVRAAPRSRGRGGPAVTGRCTWVDLEDLIRRVGKIKRFHAWTQEDDDYILEHLDLLPAAVLAARLGVSRVALSIRLCKLGVTAKSAGGRYTTRQLGDRVCRGHTAIYRWCRHGMPHTLVPGTRIHLFGLAEVARWLLANPHRVEGFSSVLRARLEDWLGGASAA